MTHPDQLPIQPTIMDCTLRDGSYSIDFSFSASDTSEIVQELDHCGVSFIEVGHGIGIGASESVAEARCSDVEYAKAAQLGRKSSKIGMFAIGGLCTPEQLKRVADHGLDFVRIGVTPDSPISR